MNLYIDGSEFNNLQFLIDLKSKRNKLDNTIDSLEKLYGQKQFLTSEEVQELEATLYDNNVADGIPIQRYITPLSKNIAPVVNVSFRINVEELFLQNLSTILYALSELSTKYWLIANGRFSDLIEYTQTHNPRFSEEAGIRVTNITYNSPVNIDISIPGIAQALITTIDGIAQTEKRFRKAELELKEKEEAINETQRKSAHEKRMNEIEIEKAQLDIEKQKFDFQQQRFKIAIESAGMYVDTLYPGIDPNARAMAIQSLLPNIIQLQNGKGLELALPPPTKPEEDKK